jgi:hypothetical protein
MTVQLPLDLTSLPPFRALEAELGPVQALWVWWSLWRELAYLAQEGVTPGRIRAEDKASVERAVCECKATWDLLLRSRLLKADGEDWVCLRYAVLNGGRVVGPRSQAQRGGDMRAFNAKQRRLEDEAQQQTFALLKRGVFVDSEGKKLEPAALERVTRLVVACDNALVRPQVRHPDTDYTEGLVQDALGVLAKFTDEEINRVVNFIAKNRGHPMLTTTEKLLPQFKIIVGLLEGEA